MAFFVCSFLSRPMFSACQCSGMLFKRQKQARTLLPLSCKEPWGDLLRWEGEQSHLWATIEFSVSLHHHHCSLRKTTTDPHLGGFKPFLVYGLNHILHRMPVVWALNRWIRLFPALYYFSHQLFCSFSCVVCIFNLQAQFPLRLVYEDNDFLYIIYTIYSALNADCNQYDKMRFTAIAFLSQSRVSRETSLFRGSILLLSFPFPGKPPEDRFVWCRIAKLHCYAYWIWTDTEVWGSL